MFNGILIQGSRNLSQHTAFAQTESLLRTLGILLHCATTVFRDTEYGRTTYGIFNWGIQNLLDFYMKVDLVDKNFNIL